MEKPGFIVDLEEKEKMILRLTKNYLSLLAAGIVDKLAYVLLFAFLARRLPQDDFGAYSLILTLIFLGAILSNFGLEYVTIREVAKDRSETTRLFNNSLALGLIFSFIAWVTVAVLARLLHYDKDVVSIISSSGFIFVFMGVEQTSVAILKAYERMEVSAFIGMLNSVLLLAFSYVVLNAGGGLQGLIWVLVTISGLKGLIYVLIVNKYFVRLSWGIDKRIMLRMLKFSVPFAMMMVYGVFIRRTGILMIGWLKPLSDVAVYGAADKCLDFVSLFGDSMAIALYPALASQLAGSQEGTGRLYQRSIGFFAILGFGGAVFLTVMAKPITVFLFGKEYAIASTALTWLAWVFFLNVLSGPASMLLMAAGDRMFRLLAMSLIVLGINIVLNLFMIPAYSYNGVAIAMLFSAFIGFLGRMALTRGYFNKFPDLWQLSWRPLLSSAAMGATCYLFYVSNIFLVFIIALLTYLIFLGIFGEFRGDKYAEIKLKINKLLNRSI